MAESKIKSGRTVTPAGFETAILVEHARKHKIDPATLLGARPYLEMLGLAQLIRLSKESGIEASELMTIVRDIAILELITADSKLSIEDAIEIGKEVNKEAWERIRKRI